MKIAVKEFVPYEEALALKELGFEEKCFGFYSPIHDLMICNTSGINEEVGECLAPLFQQAFRWFRNHKDIRNFEVKSSLYPDKYNYRIQTENPYTQISDMGFSSYEEAELACLRKLIEIVNENKDE